MFVQAFKKVKQLPRHVHLSIKEKVNKTYRHVHPSIV